MIATCCRFCGKSFGGKLSGQPRHCKNAQCDWCMSCVETRHREVNP